MASEAAEYLYSFTDEQVDIRLPPSTPKRKKIVSIELKMLTYIKQIYSFCINFKFSSQTILLTT